MRALTLRRAWLLCLGVTWIALGASLTSDASPFDTTSYEWIFYYVAPQLWGYVFMGTGILSVYSSQSQEGPRQQAAFALNSLIAFMWCAGFIAALVTHDLKGLSGIPVWGLLSFWNLLMARSNDEV